MNAVEIEEAISALAEQPFDADEFPFAFLQAFGAKETTLRRLRSGETNKSDLGGVLQTSNIHIAVAPEGAVTGTLGKLKASPATTRAKAKFVLATDGKEFQAEDLNTGEVVVCDYPDFPDHFGVFLPLAGISTVKQIRESAFDIKATGRLNRLYIELLKDNPEWSSAARRHDMNHFMARLIFSFFAEDTDIFLKDDLFTATIEKMSDKDSSNTHQVISEIFRAMNTKREDRVSAGIARWSNDFPYVNGGLFSGSTEVPRFSKIARSYLLHVGKLDWKKINPDIFGSMIQAVADDEERGALGMHYTSVPNILKVLNPLFLDDLREQLEEAGDNARKLLNLRNRMARIRVFDPACGSGNFLVIAYKEMRAIEAKINEGRGEADRRTDIPLTNFRGIELRDFPAEIARLALIIAEYQCDVLYRGQKEALADFLPLDAMNWITCGNALQLDWLSICPPTGTSVKHHADDLFKSPVDQAEIDFENEGGETYICGNPPYVGATTKAPKGASKETIERLNKEAERRKDDLESVFRGRIKTWKSLDYVCGWFMKAADYGKIENAATAFVSTNSVCQGEQVFRFWPSIIQEGLKINFAVTSFSWKNLAARNAGVTVCIVGLSKKNGPAKLFNGKEGTVREVENINAYLVPYDDIYVENRTKPMQGLQPVVNGSKPADGGGLIFDADVARLLRQEAKEWPDVIRPFFGAHDATHGEGRYCIWVSRAQYEYMKQLPIFQERFDIVSEMRGKSTKELTKEGADEPFAFQQIRQRGDEIVFQIPRHSSEERDFFPIVALPRGAIVGDGGFAFFDPPLWNISVLVSRLALSWIAAVCGKIKTDYRFSNTLGWNTLPLPNLTAKNKDDLTRCAEDILLAREAHFPATIADLYDPENMPANLRAAHDRNDEVLERIYIGRRFRNDTERLEKLFELYTKMTTSKDSKTSNLKMKA
ncbi:class I SAM-dependent DNA methyltransferase [Agrobacterium rhizogenes]|uniref:class I SAM-dependent DNA methyltransferase n=1 Tax=Rhizobium rhizogenes TaxID=359 RepID=UPI0015727276|nr:class I SAM-dependent DNA methyltransferase [Rhizobium rhizogenes]NTI62904.1 class I SAM-dependent DNA methyltransferase [Rhizobium rhizogenes]